MKRTPVTLDVECYRNYFLLMLTKLSDGSIAYYEKFEDSNSHAIIPKVLSLLKRVRIITFNGIKYDQLLVEAFVTGFSNESLYHVSQSIITENMQPWEVRKQFGFPRLDLDQIDLIEVAPLKGSLKLYAARLHAPHLEDLPIAFYKSIDEFDLPDIRDYCEKDNVDTALLYKKLRELEAIQQRAELSREYGIDLRSKSDAQIAEAIIRAEFQKRYGEKLTKPTVDPGTKYYFKPPRYIEFKSKKLRKLFSLYKKNPFTVQMNGHIGLPDILKDKKFTIGETEYKVGIGGIHSCEANIRHKGGGDFVIKEFDVASYYPEIITNNKLSPQRLGSGFLAIYGKLKKLRLEQKKIGKGGKLKIVLNGTFGKLANIFSVIYAPDLMMQVTVIGQLSLLMIIEAMELEGVQVISANTDGIVVKYKKQEEHKVQKIVANWEKQTSYTMEGTEYLSFNSCNVNNYIAICKDEETGKPKAKAKGLCADSQDKSNILKINPSADICAEAVREFYRVGTPIEDTIEFCDDFTRFITVRTVNGGAQKVWEWKEIPPHDTKEDLLEIAGFTPIEVALKTKTVTKYFAPNSESKNPMTVNAAYTKAKKILTTPKRRDKLGKVIRWYYAEGEKNAIYYMKSLNKVPKSDGAVPCMDLPDSIPENLNYDWYINEARKLLNETGWSEE